MEVKVSRGFSGLDTEKKLIALKSTNISVLLRKKERIFTMISYVWVDSNSPVK